MAEELPPGTPEVDDPLLVADLIRLLSIKGAIGRLPLADIVLPVVSLGDVVTPQINVRGPVFTSADVFSEGVITAGGAGALLADTTALPAGVYDVQTQINRGRSSAVLNFVVEHQNAAQTQVLAEWHYIGAGGDFANVVLSQTLSYELGGNERLRIRKLHTTGAGLTDYAVIFARIRS